MSNLQPRYKECEAFFGEGEYGIPTVPACMGGVALRGAEASIGGCNNPQICLPLLKKPGVVNVVKYEDETKTRVVGVVSVRRTQG